MDRVKQFREAAALENRGRERQGWRYSAELKALAVAHCRRSRDEGRTYGEIAEDLGISALTLSRWLETPAVTAKPARSFRPVTVMAATEASAVLSPPVPGELTVVTPSGFRIEGLSWPQVLELAGLDR